MTRAMDNGKSELVDAALAIEEELSGLEEVAASLETTKLGTQKSIQRAARQLQTATERQGTLADRLNALARAMMGLQDRQNKAVTRLATFAESLRARNERMNELMQTYATLGARAAEIAEQLGKADPAGMQRALEEIRPKLSEIVEGAKALSTAAEAEELVEIAREANALKQKLQSMLTRLSTTQPS